MLIVRSVMLRFSSLFVFFAVVVFAGGCAKPGASLILDSEALLNEEVANTEYLIGPGDSLDIFVWRHPDVSVVVPVRPDGRVSTPLVEDIVAIEKTPAQLARDIESVLSTYIKQPKVTVIVQAFGYGLSQQVRVVGEALQPQFLVFQKNMTLLDVMIAVGGLTDYAAGNRAFVTRDINGEKARIDVRLADLLKSGDLGANMKMKPGDILVIPEAWF